MYYKDIYIYTYIYIYMHTHSPRCTFMALHTESHCQTTFCIRMLSWAKISLARTSLPQLLLLGARFATFDFTA